MTCSDCTDATYPHIKPGFALSPQPEHMQGGSGGRRLETRAYSIIHVHKCPFPDACVGMPAISDPFVTSWQQRLEQLFRTLDNNDDKGLTLSEISNMTLPIGWIDQAAKLGDSNTTTLADGLLAALNNIMSVSVGTFVLVADQTSLRFTLVEKRSCSEGHTGPLCAVCEHGWTIGSKGCSRCSEGGNRSRAAILAVIGLLTVIALKFYILPTCKAARKRRAFDKTLKKLSKKGSIRTLAEQAQKKLAQKKEKEKPMEVMTQVKILVSLVQILSELPFALDITYPPMFLSALGVMRIIMLDVFSVFAVGESEQSFRFTAFPCASTVLLPHELAVRHRLRR